jgi:hypothetical protein
MSKGVKKIISDYSPFHTILQKNIVKYLCRFFIY